jgi:hypothetical protein
MGRLVASTWPKGTYFVRCVLKACSKARAVPKLDVMTVDEPASPHDRFCLVVVWPGSTPFGYFFSRCGVIFAGLTPRSQFFPLEVLFGEFGLAAVDGCFRHVILR